MTEKKKPKRVVDVNPRSVVVEMPKFKIIYGKKKEKESDKHKKG